MGVRKTADFLEKATWTLASALLVLSVVASMAIPKENTVRESRIKTQVEDTDATINPNMVPATPDDFPTETDE
jgi:preprotein translocase subunit SecG